ncbi:MAG: SemiSWEET family sugar transporter [Janthinobacterium lividum]
MTFSADFYGDVGLVAAGFSALTFFPQVVHTWATRSANGLSEPMLAVGAVSCLLWLVYGVYFHNLPILFGNSINLLFTLLLVFFKHHFRLLGESPRPVPAPKA